ncbi:hypothetical protein HYX12_01010 [Candidatus Woesearchaeota archaeon]|nr:hypothetical protein [Candidatus Woesearchaeota archaeon]
MHIHWEDEWAEALALFFLFLGFVISVLLQNPTITYFSVFLAGVLAARIYYIKRFREPILPFILIIIGFLVGYLIGNFWTSRVWSFIFFSIGFSVSYYLHLKKIVGIFKSENFLK